jgi:cytochrome c
MMYPGLMRSTKLKLVVANGRMAVAFCFITSFVYPGKMLENTPPEVVIVKPLQNDHFLWNTIIQYNIRITDKEDGNSEYDEINAKEVLLEVCYLPDAASAKIYTDKKRNGHENIGLTMIKRSDCFTCHATKSKLIGPSFELIAKKYKMTSNSVERLTKNIINGSTGTWGTTVMPGHKAIKPDDARQMVKWILNIGATPNVTFYPGIEGAFKTEKRPGMGSAKMVMVLTASYTDHGDKESLQNNQYGQYSIWLKPAN